MIQDGSLRRYGGRGHCNSDMYRLSATMNDINDRLRTFEPVDLDDSSSLDTAAADQLLKVFTRMAKGQWKTRQAADHAAQTVVDHLEEHGDLITDLKEQRAELQDREEQYQRFLLEVMDLLSEVKEAARQSENDAFQSAAASMQEALASSMEKIGLREIPALGEAPDSLYHYVVDTTETEVESDIIVEVVREGYLLRGYVLRKADVIVAK